MQLCPNGCRQKAFKRLCSMFSKFCSVRIFAYSMLNCAPHHEEYAFSLYVGLYLRNVNRYSVSCSGAAGNRIDNGLVIQNFACRNRCWAAGLHRIQKRTNLLCKEGVAVLFKHGELGLRLQSRNCCVKCHGAPNRAIPSVGCGNTQTAFVAQ